MPYDFQSALVAALIKNNDPSILPPAFGETKYIQGWSGNFMTAADYDPFYSSATLFFESGVGSGRSFVCSLRSQGDIWLSETFAAGNLGAYGRVETNGGVASVVTIVDSDPAVAGPGLNLRTGSTVPSVAGVTRTLGTIGDNFSLQYQAKLVAGSTVPDDAMHVWLQNNAGHNLMTRIYRDNVQAFMDSAWVTFIVHYGDYAEYWWDATKVNSTQHKVALYAGTQKIFEQTGVLPNNFTNNTLFISQQSGVYNFREALIPQINVGPTQLPDDLNVTTPRLTVPHSPSTGHVYAILEDVSVDMRNADGTLNTANVKAFISKDNGVTWVEVVLASLGAVAKGEIDNTKDMLLLAGSADFAPSTGAALRLSIRTFNGGFYPVQAYELLWDYPV